MCFSEKLFYSAFRPFPPVPEVHNIDVGLVDGHEGAHLRVGATGVGPVHTGHTHSVSGHHLYEIWSLWRELDVADKNR